MRSILSLVVMMSCLLHAAAAGAACQTIEYNAQSPTAGTVRLSMSGLIVGPGVFSPFRCLSGSADTLAVVQNILVARAAPGTVLGTVHVSGTGEYDIFYGGANAGTFAFQASWPIVKTASGGLEVQPEHPVAQYRADSKRGLLNYLSPHGVDRVNLQFRFPVFRDGERFFPTVEITVTERPAEGIGVSVMGIGTSIAPRSSSFMFQVKPWFVVPLPAAAPPPSYRENHLLNRMVGDPMVSRRFVP